MPTARAALAAWLFGLAVFAAVVAAFIHLSELEELARLLRGLRPAWLLTGFALQGLTYVCAAAVWQSALAHQGHHLRLSALIPVAFAMLFANQAFPSGGISGSVVVVRALRRRRVPADAVMAALLVGVLTTYHAALLAVLIALPTLLMLHAADTRILTVLAVFAAFAVSVPVAVGRYWRHGTPWLRAKLARVPSMAAALRVAERTPTDLLNDRRLYVKVVALQFLEVVLDAATLHAMLVALGVSVTPAVTGASFVVASAVFHVVPVPLGLGTFEGTLVAVLRLLHVPIEAALAATLLLRGLTLWLPMVPGLWWARRELAGRPVPEAQRRTPAAD